MAPRSWLFVPGDHEQRLAKVAGYGADAVIVDLEDAVAPANKAAARRLALTWLEDHPANQGYARWVRINPLDTALWRDDLASVMAGRPDGIMVPKAAGPDQLAMLDEALTELGRDDPRQAQLVELRFFAGLSLGEAARTLDVSVATANRDWRFARAWLFNRLSGSTRRGRETQK